MKKILVAFVFIAGCGSADPLIGTWLSTDIGQFSLIASSLNQTLVFSKDKKVKATAITTYRESATNARCLETSEAEGVYAISGPADNQQLVFTYTVGKFTRTECKDATQNTTDRALSEAEIALNNATSGKVVISPTTFSLTNTINGTQATYTFQKQ